MHLDESEFFVAFILQDLTKQVYIVVIMGVLGYSVH
jgi:hypothetical protein